LICRTNIPPKYPKPFRPWIASLQVFAGLETKLENKLKKKYRMLYGSPWGNWRATKMTVESIWNGRRFGKNGMRKNEWERHLSGASCLSRGCR
jgi:hypothetical protein